MQPHEPPTAGRWDPLTEIKQSQIPKPPAGYKWTKPRTGYGRHWRHLMHKETHNTVVWLCASDDPSDPRVRAGLMGTDGYWFEPEEINNMAHVLLAMKAMGTDYSHPSRFVIIP